MFAICKIQDVQAQVASGVFDKLACQTLLFICVLVPFIALVLRLPDFTSASKNYTTS